MEKDFLLLKIYGWMSFIFLLLTTELMIKTIWFTKPENALVFWILSGVCFIIFDIFIYLFSTKVQEIDNR
ncbi:putative transmembrane protein [Mycoplasma leachii 06049]|uniref:Putative transmembrane protein n=1 Tax=Mycoplasma leachii 06049 TaxID=1188244 RepID=A0A2T4IAZ3_9MOLU|nr:putative transmembrane protein [Mycoplasma leachii 06049]